VGEVVPDDMTTPRGIPESGPSQSASLGNIPNRMASCAET
jgi:hypothetical protein